jgi:undecaprenyl-diphosphatase
MLDYVKVIILGIVEGLTEFLPISSTGHLIVAVSLLDFAANRPEFRATFEIFIQLGAIVAVVIYYGGELFRQVRTVLQDASVQRLWLNILVAFLPAAVIGFVLNKWIKAALFNPTVVGMTLIIGGVIFLVIERQGVAEKATTRDMDQVSLRQAAAVGAAQVLALIPGTSRSGSTIVGGMLAGLDRPTITRFSFFLAIPTLGLATIFELLTSLKQIQSSDLAYLGLGALVSGVVAWFSIGWLLRYVSRNSFVAFGYYRIVVGAIILLLAASGRLS